LQEILLKLKHAKLWRAAL